MNKKTEQAVTSSALLIDLAKDELALAQKYEAVIAQVKASKETLAQLGVMSETCMYHAGTLQGMLQEFTQHAESIADGMDSILDDEFDDNEQFATPNLNESALRKSKLDALTESLLKEEEDENVSSERESKKEFTLNQEDKEGNIVDSYKGKAIKPLQKRVDALLNDKEALAKKKITVIEVVDDADNQVFLAMQDEGTTDKDGNDNYDGDWVIYQNNLGNTSVFSDPALAGDDMFSKVYTELVQDDNAKVTSMRILKDVSDADRYTYQEVTPTDGGILVTSEDLIFALAVATAYNLDVKPRRDGLVILIPEEDN